MTVLAGIVGDVLMSALRARGDMTAEQRKELDAPEHGVLVMEVGDGPAKTAGTGRGNWTRGV